MHEVPENNPPLPLTGLQLNPTVEQMLAWLARLFAPKPPPEPEAPSLRRRVADLESAVDYHNAEIEKLRGRVTGWLRRKRQDEEQEAPEELQPTIPDQPPPPTNGGTAHLSRRFRRF